jgi:hypothetical protein
VSKRGDELRVWELEGGFGSLSARKRLAVGGLSVRLQPEPRKADELGTAQAGLDLINNQTSVNLATTKVPSPNDLEADADELTLTRGWIGFDEENVVVLKEQSQGRQALVVYDFTWWWMNERRKTHMRASHDRDCTCTMTLWTCEFARKHLTVWAPLDIGTDELIEFTPPATVYFIELPLRNGLGDLDLNATRWDVAANNGTCRSRFQGLDASGKLAWAKQ